MFMEEHENETTQVDALGLTFCHLGLHLNDGFRDFSGPYLDGLKPLKIIDNLIPHVSFFVGICNIIFQGSGTGSVSGSHRQKLLKCERNPPLCKV